MCFSKAVEVHLPLPSRFSVKDSPPKEMRIAVIGCSHGTLNDIYASVERCDSDAQQRGESKVELMICCGDFQVRFFSISLPCVIPKMLKNTGLTWLCFRQAMRAPPDLQMMACPPKYRALGQFHNYYAERKQARCLTIVIGGNHESSGYMWEW